MLDTGNCRVDQGLIAALADLQNSQECLLGNVDAADAFHALFALFLFFEQLALARNVAAITFCNNVLAYGMYCFTRNDFCSDRGLNCHLEHLPGSEFSPLGNKKFSAPVGEGGGTEARE